MQEVHIAQTSAWPNGQRREMIRGLDGQELRRLPHGGRCRGSRSEPAQMGLARAKPKKFARDRIPRDLIAIEIEIEIGIRIRIRFRFGFRFSFGLKLKLKLKL